MQTFKREIKEKENGCEVGDSARGSHNTSKVALYAALPSLPPPGEAFLCLFHTKLVLSLLLFLNVLLLVCCRTFSFLFFKGLFFSADRPLTAVLSGCVAAAFVCPPLRPPPSPLYAT
jgi:hypothetical protein